MILSAPKTLAGTVALAALCFVAPVHALPDFHTPGTACKANNVDLAKINYTDNTGVVNVNTSSSATVFCPVDYSFDAGGVIVPRQVRVVVIDRHSSQAVTCALSHFTSDGDFVEAIASKSSTGNSSTPQVLTFTISSSQSVQRGYLNVDCKLPPGPTSSTRSHVVSYKLITS